jgi:hypothetical protein
VCVLIALGIVRADSLADWEAVITRGGAGQPYVDALGVTRPW